MPSTLTWLDTSAEEQRRVRELVALYSQSESRDELGIGQVRDAFANGLFPGTSTVHTRARYLLFIPWIYTSGAKTRRGSRLTAWTDKQELRLIDALIREGVGRGEGLIGRVAGSSLTTLPSATYWSALQRYGILTRSVSPDMLGMLRPALHAGADDELALRANQDWHPTLPAPPKEFPDTVQAGMALLPDEALWLRERILETAPNTMLAHLLIDDTAMADDVVSPWFDPACMSADGSPATLLQHGRCFSHVMRGAAILYNLLIAERYETAGFTSVPDPVGQYREDLATWIEAVIADGDLISSWDLHEMWRLVRSINPRIGLQTRAFVDRWVDIVRSGRLDTLADDEHARAVVKDRERRQKGAQSRLVNDRLLRKWSGASGTSELVYRWPQVRRLVTDIREGIASAGS